MKAGEAVKIFKNIDDNEYPAEKKRIAIGKVIKMETHNGVTKQEVLNVLAWLLNLTDVCQPEYLGENTAIGCRSGRCSCGAVVRSYQNYCSECGARLDWREAN